MAAAHQANAVGRRDFYRIANSGPVYALDEGRRPAWLIRFGLFLYDNLGGRKILPGTSTVDLTTDPVGQPLQDRFSKAYEYSDCWVEDSRLVVLNARDAQARGAKITTRTEVVQAERVGDVWQITTEIRNTGETCVTVANCWSMLAAPGSKTSFAIR